MIRKRPSESFPLISIGPSQWRVRALALLFSLLVNWCFQAGSSSSQDCSWSFAGCTNTTPSFPEESRPCSCDEANSTFGNGSSCLRRINSTWSVWGAWSLWSPPCSVGQIGVNQTRKRNRDCSPCSDCQGDNEERAKERTNCCPVHGSWGEWSKWSQNAACGNVTRSRVRQCEDQGCGGNPCFGDFVETNTTYLCCPKDGSWSEWTFGPWSGTCGSIQRFNKRTCVGAECGGSNNCEGDRLSEDVDTLCCPVDGGWGNFSFGNWSEGCGNVSRTVNRTCTYPLPNICGKPCDGNNSFREAKTVLCPVPSPNATSTPTPPLTGSLSLSSIPTKALNATESGVPLNAGIVSAIVVVPVIFFACFYIFAICLSIRNQSNSKKGEQPSSPNIKRRARATSIRQTFRNMFPPLSMPRQQQPRENFNVIYAETNRPDIARPLGEPNGGTIELNTYFTSGVQRMSTPHQASSSDLHAGLVVTPPNSRLIMETSPYYQRVGAERESLKVDGDGDLQGTVYETLSKYDLQLRRKMLLEKEDNDSDLGQSGYGVNRQPRPSLADSESPLLTGGTPKDVSVYGRKGGTVVANPLYNHSSVSEEPDRARQSMSLPPHLRPADHWESRLRDESGYDSKVGSLQSTQPSYEDMHRPSDSPRGESGKVGSLQPTRSGYEDMQRPSDSHIAKMQKY
eukprot:m.84704 g.84704  ORF g.84704 m.84704 type:complete len:680 (+) comp36414_c0_seq15:1812-3851(+)